MSFFNFNLLNIFAELVVVVVKRIFFFLIFFSNFFIIGIILINSPTLAAWNHRVFEEFFFDEYKILEIFSYPLYL